MSKHPLTERIDVLLDEYRQHPRQDISAKEALFYNVRTTVRTALGPRAWVELLHKRDGTVQANYGRHV